MAIKKSELYSSLWASCDELRGGMDASQYKDYVLTMLFVKYISDKYKNQPFGAIKVPQGSTFEDMVALIGNTEIGDKINKDILNPIKEANKLNEFPNFNDEAKLGKGKDLVDTVSNLIRIFNNPDLDFSGNTAEGDDILGDAYEYLMRHFATESGKSKGQFYTPAEVSRILAKVIGITPENSTTQTKAYDPTCGSGSLLLKVALEADKMIELYGQEKETTTANLARMNMILHNSPTADIVADNTLSRPAFTVSEEELQTFDYIVANPPFSLKNWSNGVNVDADEFDRFKLGTPPEKNGDYAFLLHIIKSLKSTGKAAVVLPHGVLFRGNAEGEIRKNILKKGYIKGIIGLPANLFYGTGIPACIIILDKEGAEQRKEIFMIDASKGFVKDGNKNCLREQDIRKITDVFTAKLEVPKYSKIVKISDIADGKNDYNLNIPRYIDTQEVEDQQNIEAHLRGGIPQADIEALAKYWEAFPGLKEDLYAELRPGFASLRVEDTALKTTILEHQEVVRFNKTITDAYLHLLTAFESEWQELAEGCHPLAVIQEASKAVLSLFKDFPLIDEYDMYQHLMAYWAEVMQDDVYSIALDGWKAGNEYQRLIIKGKKGKDGKVGKDKEVAGLAGIEGRMISPELLIDVYFVDLQQDIDSQQDAIESAQARMTEIEEEHSGEDGLLADLDKVNATEVNKLLKERKGQLSKEEIAVLKDYIAQADIVKKANATIKVLNTQLEKEVLAKYPVLRIDEIQALVIKTKWLVHLLSVLTNEQERIGQSLTQRIKELGERYATTLPTLETEASDAAAKVKAHLAKMGLVW
ncbi:type I restriction-modification system subunit M [Myroides marinus]|uniref:type I restriction-modification system subunit M n=1 Tax=Myroides marinus TaxID=703342 RepID=UPI00257547A2|nr:type I restriction-modification system subunit M [Myroides marinus]MDM1354654.1 type I restriction-modification system subunit M [Myroides marinus]MDM1366135.1 type I restriction-modification system subunit M [Myroides marinus]MDM1533685.1 type I restriction-modification system subunit M [Myroides marinus]MDM1540649.1 type I restriction-modification system subunit M [Myroides marinus]